MKERDLHRLIVGALQFARPGVKWWHTPNEGKRKRRTGRVLRGMGMLPGVADFVFVIPPNGRCHALEIKATDEKPTDDQEEFIDGINKAGGVAVWTDDFDVAIHYLRSWGVL